MKNKDIIIIAISIVIITVILIILNTQIYGTKTIYIADYMPSPMETYETPWVIVKARATIKDMGIAIIVGLIIAITEIAILYRIKILKKDERGKLLMVALIIIPVIVSAIKLSSIYGYTW